MTGTEGVVCKAEEDHRLITLAENRGRRELSSFEKGMSLVELTIVIGILGILFAAVYMFFVKGTEQFHFTRRQNQLATTGRIALEVLSDEQLKVMKVFLCWFGGVSRECTRRVAVQAYHTAA